MIKTFLSAFRATRQLRQLIAFASEAEFWQPVDGAVLIRFMQGATGQKLRARLNNMVYKSMMKACSVEENGEYMRGIARGILLTVQALDTHMDVARQPEEKDFAESTGAQADISGLAELALR